jgi:hypothetical protein
MLPYAFTALTMKAVGTAAEAMIEEIARQDKLGLLKEGANPDRVKKELAEQQILAEEYGGKVPFVSVSAKSNIGMDDLLESVILLADVEAAIDAVASTGVIQHVTELDFAINDRVQGTAVTAVTPELLADQAERYRSLMDLLLRKRMVSATLVWGISDAHSWLNGWPKPRVEAPLMFDRQLAPKPAYHALMDVARKYSA